LSDIYNEHFVNYVNSSQRKLKLEKRHFNAVMKSIYCRTAKIGVTKYSCTDCDHAHYIYRSCKNRFCARCGNMETKRWAEQSLNRLLGIKHHHIVFTLPQPFRSLAKKNEKLFYDILFRATSQAVIDWFKNKHQLKPGIVSVLHTSGSDLKYHPHIHMIVSGGGKSITSESLKELESDFLTRQRFMASKFKQFFFKELFSKVKSGEIDTDNFIGDIEKFFEWGRKIRDKHWIVSIQKPLNDIGQIVGYVGRYTKRACLSEYKILSQDKEEVKILFNDYKNTPKNTKPRQSVKTFTNIEFFDALLQHVPIDKFKMVRYYGLYSSHYKSFVIAHNNRDVTSMQANDGEWVEFEEYRELEKKNGKPDPLMCPNCLTIMQEIEVIYSNTLIFNDS